MEQRARGFQAFERSEFLAEQGHHDLALVMLDIHTDSTPLIVGTLIATELKRWNAGPLPNLNVPSSLYEEGRTLGWTIAEWCKTWSVSAGDPIETLEDIETEIAICLEEGEN